MVVPPSSAFPLVKLSVYEKNYYKFQTDARRYDEADFYSETSTSLKLASLRQEMFNVVHYTLWTPVLCLDVLCYAPC